MSARQIERLTAETEQQREARLERLSTLQSERLASETPEQRVARLLRDRQGHRDQHSQLPLLDQPSVQSKMQKFHEHFTALDVPMCVTCSKAFPGLKVNLQSGECLSCSRDKRVTKLFSSDNMNPSPVMTCALK